MADTVEFGWEFVHVTTLFLGLIPEIIFLTSETVVGEKKRKKKF